MTKTLKTDEELPIGVKMDETDRLKLESDIEKLKNKLMSLKEIGLKNSLSAVKNIEFNPDKLTNNQFSLSQNSFSGSLTKMRGDLPYIAKDMSDLKIEMNAVNEETKKFGKSSSSNFDKGTQSLKKFALSLFSIGSAYALVSKASSAYMSNDLELSKKLQNVWVGLGSFLAPAIEYISDLMMKGLGYLNEFVKALTGIDFIARANAKALDKQAQSQKNLNKQTFSFDEMNIAQSTSSSSSSGSSGLIEIPELDDRLVKKLQDLAKWLKENWNWISKVGIALGVTFGVAKISGLLSNIGKLLGGSGKGLIGLKGMLVGLAAVYTIQLYMKGYQKIKQALDELHEAVKANTEMEKGLTEQSQKLSDKFWNLADSGNASAEQIDAFKESVKRSTDRLVGQSDAIDNSQIKFFGLTIKTKEAAQQQEELAKQVEIATDDYYQMYQAGLITKEELDDFASNTLIKVIEKLKSNGVEVDNLKTKFENLTGQNYDIYVRAKLHDEVTKPLMDIINRDWNNAFNIVFGTADRNWGSTGNGGRRFARGDIVTQPTRAVIGEAGYPEAVLPLTDGYLSTLANLILGASNHRGSNSSVNNIYLDSRLIQRQIRKADEELSFAMNR